ncbi:DNA mismatch repair endonuclease MutL [Rhodopirellula sp.]|nr:DNA mismatch repair endonuclease MutL [Rhodopirellula sp.]
MSNAESNLPVIRQLPPNLINQIAAGEVIERPASVVKELLENSIDAGATRIEVTLTGGGSELIRISDNGCGMTPDQLPLAVSSHATSKLPTDEALFHVGTLGFRGEALASIGSVSHLTIRTRTASADSGSELVVRGGVIEPPAPCGAPVGTVIEVRNLFFNTPVRHRFLKTAQTEKGHIVEAFTRLALGNPNIHFVLSHNGKVLHDLPASDNWRERIHAFFGAEISESLISIHSDDGQIRISGHVGDPSVSRGNNRMQYLFLNGRHIRDRALQHALSEAYRGLLMVGRHPICFLRMEMPAEMIDVNVHPTKLEVRFTDSGRAYSRLLQSLRHQFLTTNMTQRVGGAADPAYANQTGAMTSGVGVHPSGSNGLQGQPISELERRQRQEVIDWARTGHTASSSISGTPAFRPFPGGNDALGSTSTPVSTASDASGVADREIQHDSYSAQQPSDPFLERGERLGAAAFSAGADSTGHQHADGFDGGSIAGTSAADEMSRDATAGNDSEIMLHDAHSLAVKVGPSVSYLGFQVHQRYLVTQDNAGMVVIDQHALHERVLYERVCHKVLEQGRPLESQKLLVPEPVSLTPAERTAALDAKETLAKIGIEIDDFGGETILVQSCPAILGRTSPGEMLHTLLDAVVAAGKKPDAKDLLNHLLSTIACKAAVKAGDRLNSDEITSLLEQKDLYHDTHHCPHGRPTALFFSRDELDRMFGRLGPRARQ